MKYKIISKQKNSKHCFVCGLKNDFGLKAKFFVLDNKETVALFTPHEFHQSYPGMMHGGMSATILDETIGRAICAFEKDTLGFTLDLHIKYRKPVPLNKELKVIAKVTHNGSRFFEGEGKLILPTGEVAVEAHGKYIKVNEKNIGDWDPEKEEWKVTHMKDDPDEIELNIKQKK